MSARHLVVVSRTATWRDTATYCGITFLVVYDDLQHGLISN